MQVSSQIGRKEHNHENDNDCDSCGHDHEHTNFRLTTMIAGVVFIANSFIMEWFNGTDNQVAGISAFIGAMILGFPIGFELDVQSLYNSIFDYSLNVSGQP